MSQIPKIPPSDITPEEVYRSRREFLARLAGAGLAAGLSGAAAQEVLTVGLVEPALQYKRNERFSTREKMNSIAEITGYNNFYEFGTDKEDPAEHAHSLRPRPWTVVVDGECEKPGRLLLDDLLKPHALEERIYRLRCVEAWSMVIPWIGFPLGDLVKRFQPTSKAKFVEFTTLLDPKQMPGQRYGVLDSMANGSRTRTARRCGSSCRGSTGSRASSPSCASASPSGCPGPAGRSPRPTSMVSTRT